MQPFIALLSRLLMSLIFLYGGYHKLLHPSETIQKMTSMGIHYAKILYALIVAIEVFGGLLLLLGGKTKRVAFALAIYLIPVTYYFHSGIGNAIQLTQFLKNIAIIGGLFNISIYGGGPFSLDRK